MCCHVSQNNIDVTNPVYELPITRHQWSPRSSHGLLHYTTVALPPDYSSHHPLHWWHTHSCKHWLHSWFLSTRLTWAMNFSFWSPSIVSTYREPSSCKDLLCIWNALTIWACQSHYLWLSGRGIALAMQRLWVQFTVNTHPPPHEEPLPVAQTHSKAAIHIGKDFGSIIHNQTVPKRI